MPYIVVALNGGQDTLGRADTEPGADVHNQGLSAEQGQFSLQLFYMLVLLTKHCALDKGQAAGDGEGLETRRLLHEQYEP
eukprot:1707191-Amphidinium_carterae.1